MTTNVLRNLQALDPSSLLLELRELHRAICDHSVTEWSIEATPNGMHANQFRHFVLRVDVVYDGQGKMARNTLGIMSRGELDVLNERRHQVEKHGSTAERDAGYQRGELRQAAIAYICGGGIETATRPTNARVSITGGEMWPFELDSFNPAPAGDRQARRHDLVTAAALILAEIDRLDHREAARG